MLQVARLAANPLRDAAGLVAAFVRGQLNPDGGFANKAGDSDLYYTVFGIDCLIALRQDVPVEAVARFLRGFGDGDALDLVHLTSLARCWVAIGHTQEVSRLRPHVIARLAQHRTPEGGYHVEANAAHGSAYGCFLALGASQDVAASPPHVEGVRLCLDGLACGDGSYSNDTDITLGSTPATAAALTLQHQLGLPIDPRSSQWLLERCHEEGGFFALPGAPIPDLLSTAVTLHALTAVHADLSGVKERCLDFIDTLWTAKGSFYGNWAEETLDVEYTYYGLLALGHLSLI